MCNNRPYLKLSALALGVWMVCPRTLPAAITNIVDSSTDLAASLPSAALSPSLFNSGVPCIRDRAHCPKPAAFYSDGRLSLSTTPDLPGLFPAYLVGQQYVYFKQGTRTWTNYTATISVDQNSTAYLLVDNRVSDGVINSYSTFDDPVFGTNVLVYTNAVGNQCVDNVTPTDFPLTQWVIDDGWTRVNTGLSPHYNNPGYCIYDLVQGDYLGIDEGCNVDLNQFYAVYTKTIPAGGSVTVQQQAGGFNMYSLVVSTNTAPLPQWAIWSSKAHDTLWDTVNNWYANSVPAPNAAILFPETASGKTVSLNSFGPTNGPLLFTASGDYNVGGSGDALTLSGGISQNGSGLVTFDNAIELGGASRMFGGSGSGVVTLNGPITDNAASGARAILNGGNYVIANAANTVDRFEVNSGAKATIVGTATVPDYPSPSYFGGNGSGGGFYASLDGGVLDYQATQVITGFGDGSVSATALGDWADRAIIYGPNGGTLVLNSTNPVSSPTVWFSQGGTSTLVVGEPLPYSGDPWDPVNGVNNWRSPFEVEYGVSLGIFQNSSYTYAGAPQQYKWRQGWGDFQLILTNGASAFLEWNVMTNGYFIIRGQPGGDSSVIETNATGWTGNVGRFAIRGPHRNGQQYTNLALFPNGTISRSFYMDQPYGMVFHDAVQVWNRDGLERLACDMSFESGSSVDFCSGRRSQALDLGHPGNAAIGQAGPTNTMTIKAGGKANLNLQMRSQIGEGRTAPRGESAGLRIWSFIDIKDGGELKIYRSQTNALGLTEQGAGDTSGSSTAMATKCIELFRPIIGNGSSLADSRLVVDLPWSPPSNSSKDTGNNNGKNGVNFEANPASMGGSYPGALPIVNGLGDYGLRLVGQGADVTNFLEAVRSGVSLNALAGLSGSGGTLTVALTDTATIDIKNGPSAASAVKLGFDKEGSNTPTYVLGTDASLANFAGLVLKSGTAVVNDASTVTMQTLKLVGATTIQLGTATGGAVLHFAKSSPVAWNAGTLSITSWNGSASGGGADRIFFGSDATGLTAGQLAQIKWVNPLGSGDVTGAAILATGEIVPAATTPTTIGSPAIVGGQLVFQVVPGSPSQTSVIQCATNLTAPVVWSSVQTNTGAFSFTNAAALPASYYRVLVQ